MIFFKIFNLKLKNLLQFIKNMIYFNKLIDICINRQESQKVVDNYFVGTKNRVFFKYSIFLLILNKRDGEFWQRIKNLKSIVKNQQINC